MPDRILLHIVWTTRDREPLISQPVARFLSRFLRAVARQERTEVLAMGMVRTHVHVLARVHPTTSIPRLLQRWKGGSAVIAAREGVVRPRGLAWAKSYSVTSVGPRQLPAVRDYVANQAQRHPDTAIGRTCVRVGRKNAG
jgi:putative transposase